jgi:hypothetical protein
METVMEHGSDAESRHTSLPLLASELRHREMERRHLVQRLQDHIYSNFDEEDWDDSELPSDVEARTLLEVILNHKRQILQLRVDLRAIGFSSPRCALLFDPSLIRLECNTELGEGLNAIFPGAVSYIERVPFRGRCDHVVHLKSHYVFIVNCAPLGCEVHIMHKPSLKMCRVQLYHNGDQGEDRAQQFYNLQPQVRPTAQHPVAPGCFYRSHIFACCAAQYDGTPADTLLMLVGPELVSPYHFEPMKMIRLEICDREPAHIHFLHPAEAQESPEVAVDVPSTCLQVLHASLFSQLAPLLKFLLTVSRIKMSNCTQGVVCIVQIDPPVGCFCHVFDPAGTTQLTRREGFHLPVLQSRGSDEMVLVEAISEILNSSEFPVTEPEHGFRRVLGGLPSPPHPAVAHAQTWNREYSEKEVDSLKRVLSNLCWMPEYTDNVLCNPFDVSCIKLASPLGSCSKLVFTNSAKIPFLRLSPVGDRQARPRLFCGSSFDVVTKKASSGDFMRVF